MRLCICQICQCGRHRCDVHDAKKTPFAKGDTDTKPLSESREKYRCFGDCRRPPAVKQEDQLTTYQGDEPMAKASMTKKDYVPYGLTAKRPIMRPKVTTKHEDVKMADATTYGHDYMYIGGERAEKAKVSKDQGDGTMPGTLPGKFEDVSTYGRSFTPKPIHRRHPAAPREGSLVCSDKPFIAATETMIRYQKPPLSRREIAKPAEGELCSGDGKFEGKSTTKSDYPAYPKQDPTKSCRKDKSWKPGSEKFEGLTMYKSQFKYPAQAGRRPPVAAPVSNLESGQGPFKGVSRYKSDFPAYPNTGKRSGFEPSKVYNPPTVPMADRTSYRRDFRCPPDDVVTEKCRPMRSNLTCGSGPMEDRTMTMKDFPPFENPRMRKSFRPDTEYKKPEGKFADHSLTARDYTWKKSETAPHSKQQDNLETGQGPMEDLTMTMKDFQWMGIDCPAAYIKLHGKDALPQFQYDKTVGGHEYFKKVKRLKSICVKD